MRLTALGKNLAIYCTYAEREIPVSLGGRWSSKNRVYLLTPSIMLYQRIIDELHDVHIEIDPRVTHYFESKINTSGGLSVDFQPKTKPFAHQTQTTQFVLTNQKCFIFSEVGVGKSKSVIDAADARIRNNQVSQILVVSPASIMCNFANEIKIHSHYDACVIDGSLYERQHLIRQNEARYHIVNYDMLHKLQVNLINHQYGMIIFDEIHRVKNRTAISSKAAYEIAQSVTYRVGMSGTIICNNYVDIFSPYKIIDKAVFGESFTAFKQMYLVMGGYMDYEIVGYKRENNLKNMVASNSILFKLRDLIDIPDEIVEVKEFELSETTKTVYRNALREMMIEFKHIERPISNTLEKILRLTQITSGFTLDNDDKITDIGDDKLQILSDIIDNIEGQVIVFCHYRHSIDRISALCSGRGWTYYTFDGRTTDKSIYKNFNNGERKIWIAQLQTSVGYSIPAAKHAIFYELDHSRVNHTQSKGRNLRVVGSDKGACVYIYLCAKNTIELKIYDSLLDKDFTAVDALKYVKGGI